MKPVDLRNATWEEVCLHVTDDMHRVHQAWLEHGPCTTRQLAERSGISLLTLRPRTTDLYKLGLVTLYGRLTNEGIYQHCSAGEALESAAWRTRADFRRETSAPAESAPRGFLTVDEAINSLPVADRAALGARLMAKYGTLQKKYEAGRIDQLSLAV